MVGNESSGNRTKHGSTRVNVQSVFLATEVWIALDKMVAKYEISRKAAILYCVNETLYREGFHKSVDDYNMFKERYLEPLINIVKRKRKENQSPSVDAQDAQEKKILSDQAKLFSEVIDQWESHPDLDWRQKWRRKAEKWKDKLSEAQKILELSDQDRS